MSMLTLISRKKICNIFLKRTKLTSCCAPQIKLKGRKLIDPKTLTNIEIKSILWTVLELREMYQDIGVYIDSPIRKLHVTVLLSKPSIIYENLCQAAALIMGVKLSLVVDPYWETQPHLTDFGKFFSKNTDLVFVCSKKYAVLEDFSKGMEDIPLLSLESCRYAIPRVLSDIATIYIRQGHLNNLNIGWLGAPTKVLNTYLCIMPSLGINIRYCNACKDHNCISPVTLPFAQELSKTYNSKVIEYTDHKEMLKESSVVYLSPYCSKDLTLTQNLVEELSLKNWSFLYTVPRIQDEVHPSIINLENNLVWTAVDTFKWVICAFMLRFLHRHIHVSCPPDFECPQKKDF